MNLRWARPPSLGLWWQLCVRQQWKVSTPTTWRIHSSLKIAPLIAVLLSERMHSLCLMLYRTDDNTNCRVDTAIIQRRLPVLLKYLNSDTERQLQALYALQALIVALDQPPSKCRIIVYSSYLLPFTSWKWNYEIYFSFTSSFSFFNTED